MTDKMSLELYSKEWDGKQLRPDYVEKWLPGGYTLADAKEWIAEVTKRKASGTYDIPGAKEYFDRKESHHSTFTTRDKHAAVKFMSGRNGNPILEQKLRRELDAGLWDGRINTAEYSTRFCPQGFRQIDVVQFMDEVLLDADNDCMPRSEFNKHLDTFRCTGQYGNPELDLFSVEELFSGKWNGKQGTAEYNERFIPVSARKPVFDIKIPVTPNTIMPESTEWYAVTSCERRRVPATAITKEYLKSLAVRAPEDIREHKALMHGEFYPEKQHQGSFDPSKLQEFMKGETLESIKAFDVEIIENHAVDAPLSKTTSEIVSMDGLRSEPMVFDESLLPPAAPLNPELLTRGRRCPGFILADRRELNPFFDLSKMTAEPVDSLSESDRESWRELYSNDPVEEPLGGVLPEPGFVGHIEVETIQPLTANPVEQKFLEYRSDTKSTAASVEIPLGLLDSPQSNYNPTLLPGKAEQVIAPQTSTGWCPNCGKKHYTPECVGNYYCSSECLDACSSEIDD